VIEGRDGLMNLAPPRPGPDEDGRFEKPVVLNAEIWFRRSGGLNGKGRHGSAGIFRCWWATCALQRPCVNAEKIGSSIPPAWRRHYNTVRPHSSVGYRPPAPKMGYAAIAALRFRFALPAAHHGARGNHAL